MNDKIKFIDLFAGIGGFRLGMEKNGFECVYSCEINEHACQVYEANYGVNPMGDITKLNPKELPEFDILCAGFPCQTFSICGKQKGFHDTTRGTLFFDICRILEEKQPKAFILENVQNLEKHDKGNTLYVMMQALNELGYSVTYRILNAKDFGVPQNRERIIIVGNREGKIFDFDKIILTPVDSMKPFLDKEGKFEYLNPEEYTILTTYKRQPKSGLIFIGYRNKKIRTVGVRPGTEHLSRVHKQPNRIYSSMGIHPTIASQEQSGRYWIFDEGKVRKLTLNECFEFMGFPSEFKKIGLTSKLYERIGNSICVNMVEAVSKELKNQFFNEKGEEITVKSINPTVFLEQVYKEALQFETMEEIGLGKRELEWVKCIYEKEENFKGVFTVLVTSLTYKCLYPQQDVRYHQANMKGGYSGRSFDTKYVTPFLKIKQFSGAMKESGWLTRSLEQNIPYNLEFPGKIQSKEVKNAFLFILDDICVKNADPYKYLLAIFKGSITEKAKKVVNLINPIQSEAKLSIEMIIDYMKAHFYYPYKSRGASILPVIAIYSVYECMVSQMERYHDKILEPLASHNSSDKSSGAAGDIVVKYLNGEPYEVIEVKFDISINTLMVMDAYEKIKPTKIQRYYMLSTKEVNLEEKNKMKMLKYKIGIEHGCQVIINGVFSSLEYYLRLLDNTDNFIDCYIKNLELHPELNYEHKIAWNTIMKNGLENSLL